MEARRRHARQPGFAARPLGERIELDEEKNLGNRDGDHGEVDAGTPQRDQADEVADDCGCNHAEEQRGHDIWKSCACEKISSDKAAGAVKGGLAERQETRKSEQNVKADPE